MSLLKYCLGSTEDTEDPEDLWNKPEDNFLLLAEAKVSGLLTEYCTASIRSGETTTQYVGREVILENRLLSAGKRFKQLENIRTILRGIQHQYCTTRDLIRELKKNCREAIEMITEKRQHLGIAALDWIYLRAKHSDCKRFYNEKHTASKRQTA